MAPTNSLILAVISVLIKSCISLEILTWLGCKLSNSSNDIFFVHPGYIDKHLIERDSLIEGRIKNLEFLMSDKFYDTLLKYEVNLNKFIHDT